MKNCPKCGAEFNDDLSFCLNDGSPLPAAIATPPGGGPAGEKTFELPARQPSETRTYGSLSEEEQATAAAYDLPKFEPPPPARSGSRMTYLLPLTLLGLGGFILVAATAIGLFVFMRQRSVDVAKANTNEVPNAVNMIDHSNRTENPQTSPSNVFAGNSTVAQTNTEPTSGATPKTRTPTPTPKRDDDIQEPPGYPPPVSARPTPNRTSVPRTISGGVLNGKAISLPKPPYPPAARAVRASGAVSVQVLIDEDGRVISASAVSGHPLLRSAAEAAARAARFSPTMLSGQPVKVSGIITYNFVP